MITRSLTPAPAAAQLTRLEKTCPKVRVHGVPLHRLRHDIRSQKDGWYQIDGTAFMVEISKKEGALFYPRKSGDAIKPYVQSMYAQEHDRSAEEKRG